MTPSLNWPPAGRTQYLVLPAHLSVDDLAARILTSIDPCSADFAGCRVTVWDDLQGQPAVVEQLRQATLGEGLTHAWLFTGPPGSGTFQRRKAFAACAQL